MTLTHTGKGRPLLLVHGLGNTRRVWRPVMEMLSKKREVITVDLPGHGGEPAESDSGTFLGLAGSLERLLDKEGLTRCDMAGSSLGGQLVLEMARRGKAGATVALDPGGFWQGWERPILSSSLKTALWAARGMKPGLPLFARHPASRTMMLGMLSNRPWLLEGDLVAAEMRAFADTDTLDRLIDDLAFGTAQTGPAAGDGGPVTIGWGRHDRLCNPGQAARAVAAFPQARLHWFEQSGHFPMWDEPDAAARLILEGTAASTLH
ncbi:MAG: alpha/beta fold hydrolase [Allosphingosinicella sp.]